MLTPATRRTKNNFNRHMRLLMNMKSKRKQTMTKKDYDSIRNAVALAKRRNDSNRKPGDAKLLAKFDLIKVGKVMRLIVPLKNRDENVRYFVHTEELFLILHKLHMNMDHCSKDVMIKMLKEKYANITHEIVDIYMKLCSRCERKKTEGSPKKLSHEELIRESEKIERKGHFDVMTMEAYPDHPYKYILMYQDLLTKFILLKPLRTKNPNEIACELLSLFCMFGSPNILQSSNGREMAQRVVQEICRIHPNAKLVYAGSEPVSLEKEKKGVGENLTAWMENGNTQKWSEGLCFVQMMENEKQNDEIGISPFKAMFGRDFNFGLNWSPLSKEVVSKIETEEELVQEVKKLKKRRNRRRRRD